MKICSLKFLAAIVAPLLVSALPASAVSFDFYKLGRGAGDFSPNGVAGTDYFSIFGDNVSSNVSAGTFNGNLKFTSGGITATATATSGNGSSVAAVVQDSEPAWDAITGAGLGVYHIDPLDTSDDNITAGETLTLTFSQTVRITSIALRSDGHNFTNFNAGDTFLLNGGSTFLPLSPGTGSIPVDLTGTQFTFAFGGSHANQFYLAGLEARTVPDGGLTITLLGLSTIGLGVFRARFAKP